MSRLPTCVATPLPLVSLAGVQESWEAMGKNDGVKGREREREREEERAGQEMAGASARDRR